MALRTSNMLGREGNKGILLKGIMFVSKKTIMGRWKDRFHQSRIARLFFGRKFFHYTWIGIFISFLNIFFLWLFIDIFGIPTVMASTLVIGSTFVLRYVLFDLFKVL